MIFKMVSEPLQDQLGHLLPLSGFCYQVTHHLCPRTKPNMLVVRGVLKSPKSNKDHPPFMSTNQAQ